MIFDAYRAFRTSSTSVSPPAALPPLDAALAGMGAAGGVLLDTLGPASFPWSVLALLLPALVVVLVARRHAFPARRPVTT